MVLLLITVRGRDGLNLPEFGYVEIVAMLSARFGDAYTAVKETVLPLYITHIDEFGTCVPWLIYYLYYCEGVCKFDARIKMILYFSAWMGIALSEFLFVMYCMVILFSK